MLNSAAFEASLSGSEPPSGLSRPLLALWHAGRDDWDRAHALAQEAEGDAAHDWVHAYLHRVEGDEGNARYWYRRAGRAEATGDLRDEWRAITGALIEG